MDFFGIGFLEIFFIVLIAMIVLGPKDMVKAGRAMGRFLRKLMLSPGFMEAQRWVRNLPAQLMREAGIDEIQNELRQEAARIKEETTVSLDPVQESQRTIARPPSSSPSPAYPPPISSSPPHDSTAGAEPEPEIEEESGAIQAAPPADLPEEWLGAPPRPSRKTRPAPATEFPSEWITPPAVKKNSRPAVAPSQPSPAGEEDTNQD